MSKGRSVPPASDTTLAGLCRRLRQAAPANPDGELLLLAARVLDDLSRRLQPARDERGMVTLGVESGVAARDGSPMVQIQIGETALQTTPTAARGYALQLLAAASDAESEAAVTAVFMELELPPALIGQVLQRIRAERQRREAKGARTA